MWFGCGLRLCRLDDSGIHILGDAEGLPPERWAAMARDEQGTLWLRGPEHLYVLPAGAQRFIARGTRIARQSSNTVMSVVTTPGGALVSTDLGVARWSGNHWEIIGSAQGLEADAVRPCFTTAKAPFGSACGAQVCHAGEATPSGPTSPPPTA